MVERRTWVNIAVRPCLHSFLTHNKHRLFENKGWEIYIFYKEVYSFVIEVVIISWLCSRVYLYTRCILYSICIDACLIFLKSVIVLFIIVYTTFSGKSLLQRVVEINLISASSTDSHQIIKALCVRVLIRLFFCLVGQK